MARRSTAEHAEALARAAAGLAACYVAWRGFNNMITVLNLRRVCVASCDKGATLSVSPRLLQGLSFAVFGLGDRRYREFNYAVTCQWSMHKRKFTWLASSLQNL